MFWRKKKKIDLEFPSDSREHRSAYRIKPDPMRPIILNLAGNSYPLTNISGTGCCFRSHNFPEGYIAACTLKIPSEDIIFPVNIRVVARKRDICRCEFTKITEKAEDAIHAYVLDVQKEQIRSRHHSI